MADVFLSYRNTLERRAFVKRLALLLRAHEVTVWWDYGLEAGESYRAQITQELSLARIVAPLWCAESVVSKWVQMEAELGKDKLVPARLQKVVPPDAFEHIQAADLIGWDGAVLHPRVLAYVAKICERLGKPSRAPIDMMEELSDLKKLTPLPESAGRVASGAPSQGQSPGLDFVLADLRATWVGFSTRDDTGAVERLLARVRGTTPGSGLEFEIEEHLAALRDQQSQRSHYILAEEMFTVASPADKVRLATIREANHEPPSAEFESGVRRQVIEPITQRLVESGSQIPMPPRVAVDLGTANTRVFIEGLGVVLSEPSVVAYVNEGGVKVVYAVGGEAKNMLGKTHRNMEIIRPLRDGVIADFDVAEEMIKRFFQIVLPPQCIDRASILVTVPSGATPLERKTIKECMEAVGASQVRLIEEPLAAALGAGLDIDGYTGCMVVNIGAGTTEIAVLSLGGLVWSRSLRIAGDKMDEAIIEYLRLHQNLMIGDSTAERIKKEIAAAKVPTNGQGMSMPIKGRDSLSSVPKEITVTEAMLANALAEHVARIGDAVLQAFEQMPRELALDIRENGIMLTGAGSGLHLIGTALRDQLAMDVFEADDSHLCVIRGCALAMERTNAGAVGGRDNLIFLPE